MLVPGATVAPNVLLSELRENRATHQHVYTPLPCPPWPIHPALRASAPPSLPPSGMPFAPLPLTTTQCLSSCPWRHHSEFCSHFLTC